MADKDKKYSAVYVSWVTFTNTLKQLSQALPHQIDRSVLTGLAWAIQSQLITGLKFLGLIDESGKPTPTLAALTSADSEAATKQQLTNIFRERYSELFKLDLLKASPLQVQQAMSQHYGVTGATLERAIRFFVSGAEYCGIPISPHLAGKKPNGAPPKKKRTPKPKAPTVTTSQPTPASEAGTARTVTLVSGGTLTLTASLDLFALLPPDRRFVFELIDKLDAYEQGSASTETPGGGTPGVTKTKGDS